MKKIIYSLALLITLMACDKNDDQQTDPQNPTDGFTVNNTFYETPNCYIEFDDDQSEINLFFTNGRMYDNDANVNGSSGDYLFTLNTTNFVFYNIRDNENPSINTPSYPNFQTGVQYVGGPTDSVIGHHLSIESLSPPFFYSGFEFGMDNEVASQNDPLQTIYTPGAIGPFITLNSYSFDSQTQTGTINVDYEFLTQNGETITGHYEGTIGVILD